MHSVKLVCYLGYVDHPKTAISTFCVAFHSLVVSEHRSFKFGVQIDHSQLCPKDG